MSTPKNSSNSSSRNRNRSGMHPEENLPIYLKVGPYGPYVQLGEPTEEQPKPKRVGLTKAQDPENLTFEEALALLELPKRLGHHPETGKVVKVGVGMYGPYVLHDKTYGNFDKKTHTYEFEGKTYNVLNVTLEAAVDMLKNTQKTSRPHAHPRTRQAPRRRGTHRHLRRPLWALRQTQKTQRHDPQRQRPRKNHPRGSLNTPRRKSRQKRRKKKKTAKKKTATKKKKAAKKKTSKKKQAK